MRNRILHKFLITYIVLIFVAIVILDFLVSIKLKDYYEEKITDKLKSTSFLTVKILQEKGVVEQNSFVFNLAQDVSKDIEARVTIVDKEGVVLGDSEEAPYVASSRSSANAKAACLSAAAGVPAPWRARRYGSGCTHQWHSFRKACE